MWGNPRARAAIDCGEMDPGNASDDLYFFSVTNRTNKSFLTQVHNNKTEGIFISMEVGGVLLIEMLFNIFFLILKVYMMPPLAKWVLRPG